MGTSVPPDEQPAPEPSQATTATAREPLAAPIRLAVEASADCIKVLGLDGSLEYMNEGGMCVMEIEDFGPFQGACWPDFWQGEENAKANAALDQARAGDVGRFQGYTATAKGNVRHWDVTVSPVPGLDGRPEKLLSVSRDITAQTEAQAERERLQAELDLERAATGAARARLDRTLETAEAATFDYDVPSDRVYGNRLLDLFFGMPPAPEGASMAPYFQRIHEGDRARVQAAIAESLATGSRYEVQYRVLGSDGRERTVLGRGDTTLDASGAALRFSGVLLDVTARLSAERALAEARARFDGALETAEVASFDWDVPNDRVRGNARLALFLGIPDDPEGTPVDECFAAVVPEDLAGIQAAVAGALERGGPYEAQYRVAGADGRERWVLARGTATLGGDGRPERLTGMLVDVTERVRAEGRRAFLSALGERLRDLSDPDELLREASRAVAERVGADRVGYAEDAGEDLVAVTQDHADGVPSLVGLYRYEDYGADLVGALHEGRTVVRHDVQGDPTMGEQEKEAHRALGLGSTVNVPLLRDGRLRAILFAHHAGAHAWDAGELALLEEAAQRVWDAVERARSEVARRSAQETFRTVFEQAPDDSILVMDAGRRIVAWNPAAERTMGWSPEEAVGQPADLIFTPEDRAAGAVMDELFGAVLDGHAPDERWHLRKDGSRFWGSGTMNALYHPDGSVRGYLKIFRDATDRHEAGQLLEARVRERTADLQRAVEQAEGFSYAISHDLRTPLRAIAMTSNILLEEAAAELSSFHREQLERQNAAATRMAVLIDGLLQLSRLARAEMKRRTIDMTAEAKAVGRFESDCGIEVQEGMAVEGDPGMVASVLQNLVGNACKFSPNGGTIRVGQEEDGAFFVSDEGVGFDMAFAPKVFRPFERLVANDEFPGTGIGLANVQRIVERHGGRVWCESAPGKGSTFWFTLG